MNKSSIIIPKDLRDDIQKLGSNVAKEIAIHAREELTMAYIGAIDTFYHSYAPLYYDRRWTLFDSYQKYYTNAHGTIFYGGVKITDVDMGDLHQNPDNEVLDLALHGWHGHPARGIYREPRPIDLIYQYRDDVLKNIQSWGDDAIHKAKTKYKYKMLY